MVETALSLRCAYLAGRRSGWAAAPGKSKKRPESRMGPSLQRRRHLYARQVGISLVRGVGSCVSLHPTGPDRSRFRQGTADSALSNGICILTANFQPTNGLLET